ncbi:Uncharacterized protein HZ326_22795 [Fusarium oxysporum f. sp. albedinis]|nr:Uncharacterized protein HZ326_22795 [Fusarium oxysporum f. sp. albedinis]
MPPLLTYLPRGWLNTVQRHQNTSQFNTPSVPYGPERHGTTHGAFSITNPKEYFSSVLKEVAHPPHPLRNLSKTPFC